MVRVLRLYALCFLILTAVGSDLAAQGNLSGVGKAASGSAEDAATRAAQKSIAEADSLLVAASKNVNADIVVRSEAALKAIMDGRGDHQVVLCQDEVNGTNTGAGGGKNRVGVFHYLLRDVIGVDAAKPVTDKALQALNPGRGVMGMTIAEQVGFPLMPTLGFAVHEKGLTNRIAFHVAPVETLRALLATGQTPYAALAISNKVFFQPWDAEKARRGLGVTQGWSNLHLVCGSELPQILKRVREIEKSGRRDQMKDVAETVRKLVNAFKAKYDKEIFLNPGDRETTPLRANDFALFELAIEARDGDVKASQRLEAVIWNYYGYYCRFYPYLDRQLAGVGDVFDGDYPALECWLDASAFCGDDIAASLSLIMGKILGQPDLGTFVGTDLLGLAERAIVEGVSGSYWSKRTSEKSEKSREDRVIDVAVKQAVARGLQEVDIAEFRANLAARFMPKAEEADRDRTRRVLTEVVGPIVRHEKSEQRTAFRARAASVVLDLFRPKKRK